MPSRSVGSSDSSSSSALPWNCFTQSGRAISGKPVTGQALRRTFIDMHIPKHPFPMETVFRTCFLVNFGMEPAVLARLLPAPIEPEVRGGEAFVSIVIADLHDMRPAFVPRGWGFDFSQVVYRAIVTLNGERGVHFLRSDANDRLMCVAGNLFSFFRFNHAAIASARQENVHRVEVRSRDGVADIRAAYDMGQATHEPPGSSVFTSLVEAKAFFAELYVAFSTLPGYTTAVRIDRANWGVRFVSDERATYSFMDGSSSFPKGSTRVDSVFHVENVSYRWHVLEKSRHAY